MSIMRMVDIDRMCNATQIRRDNGDNYRDTKNGYRRKAYEPQHKHGNT